MTATTEALTGYTSSGKLTRLAAAGLPMPPVEIVTLARLERAWELDRLPVLRFAAWLGKRPSPRTFRSRESTLAWLAGLLGAHPGGK